MLFELQTAAELDACTAALGQAWCLYQIGHITCTGYKKMELLQVVRVLSLID